MSKRPGDSVKGWKPKNKKKKLTKREKSMVGCTKEDVLDLDVSSLLSKLGISDPEQKAGNSQGEVSALPEEGSEITVEVKTLASTGEGLAIQQGSKTPQVYVVPFTIPGDVARVKVFRHFASQTTADLVSIITPSPSRDDSLVRCQYFGKCGGCQFQMMPYEAQLQHKRDIVVKAFLNFSDLPPEQIPQVEPTVGSPLQYGYRTKLTPHFEAPRGEGKSRRKHSAKANFSECPPIGFMVARRRTVLDIEDCPIATDAVRKGLTTERKRMQNEFGNYNNGATILLRETTKRIWDNEGNSKLIKTAGEKGEGYRDFKSCITDNKANSFEYVDNYVFKNPAGSFFQNNNSILPLVTEYVRNNISGGSPIRLLIDAYCGSGLFAITLSSLFGSVNRSRSPSPHDDDFRPQKVGAIGIDISEDSVRCARENAVMSGLPRERTTFHAADAGSLFRRVEHYDSDKTAVVIDPPRKGCSGQFLRQLMEMGPRRVVYVSCNVHTQARDIGMLVRGKVDALGEKMAEDTEATAENTGKERARYEIESIRGFDFFPQTGHVEGVAILNRVGPAPRKPIKLEDVLDKEERKAIRSVGLPE